jgi:hypothetical protein
MNLPVKTILIPNLHEPKEASRTIQGDLHFGFIGETGNLVTVPWNLRAVSTHRHVLNIDIRYNRLSTRR